MDPGGDPGGGDQGGMNVSNLYQDSKERRDTGDGLQGSGKGSIGDISGKKSGTLKEPNDSMVQPAVFRFDKEKKEIVRICEYDNVVDANIKAGDEGGEKSGGIVAYSRNVEEYKQIYKDMILWETIVKKREEANARGSLRTEGVYAFLEDTKWNYLKFKKLERNHIMSGVIDERNIWEDSNDEEEGDEDSVEMVQEAEDGEESEDEKMAEIEHHTKRFKENDIEIEAFSETAGDEVMREKDTGSNQGEKRKSVEDYSQEQGEDGGTEGWTKVVNKKNQLKRQNNININAESNDIDVPRYTDCMHRREHKVEETTNTVKVDGKAEKMANIIESPYVRQSNNI